MLYETEQQRDERFMAVALQEAAQAASLGEVPVGAVIVHDGQIVGRGHNLTERLHDVTAHAEMQAVTSAAATLGGKYLQDCTLYVTVEPCLMCAGALGWAQVSRVVFGTPDPRRGYSSLTTRSGARSPLHPKAFVASGFLEDQCRAIMQEFFRIRRK